MHRDLRVVGAGLDADVAVAAGRVEVVPDEPGQVLQRGWLAVGEAEPVIEEGRTVADGDGEVRRVEVVGLAGVLGGTVGTAADDAARSRFGTCGHPLGRAGPGLQHVREGGLVLGDHVERHEVHPVLGGRDDPGLALAPEGHRVVGRGGVARGPGVGAGLRRGIRATDAGHGTDDGRSRADAQQSAAGHLGRGLLGHVDATTPATWEIGSLSASRATVSDRISFVDRAV